MRFVLSPKFPRTMRKVVAALSPWRWCLIGGRAVEIWANPPQTPDIDCLAAVKDEDVPQLKARFQRTGIRTVEVYAGMGTPILFLRDVSERVDVDVLGAYDPMHTWIIFGALHRTVQGIRIPVARPEGVVALKAQSAIDIGRPAGKRNRDRKAIDVLARLKAFDKKLLEGILIVYGWREEWEFLKSRGVLS